jgi:hypothetical protein
MNLFKAKLLVAVMLCASISAAFTSAALAQDDVAKLNDEFDNEATANQWRRVEQVEGWNNNQLEIFDINKIYPGQCAMMPYTSSWYQDWRGVLLFKPIKGDFVITTKVKVTGRDGASAPKSRFSLAGLMIRAPRNITPQTWQPGGENYVFVSLGASLNPGVYSFEYKTTRNSKSDLKFGETNVNEAQLQIARIGTATILAVKPAQGAWRILGRFDRPDLPEELQAGMTAYTDWPGVERVPPREHNATVIRGGNPDLGALYDYVRFARPRVPEGLQGRNLANANEVSDAELLRFLGDAAIGTGGNNAPTAAPGFATGAAATGAAKQ